jgi:hypothetical protein
MPPFISFMPSNPSADPENVADDNNDAGNVQDFVRDEGIRHQTATAFKRIDSGMNSNDDSSNNNYLDEAIVDVDDHESENELYPSANTGKENRAISVDDDATSQGKVESVATSTENLLKTRETSHGAKNVSDQDEAKSASSHNAGETKMPSNLAGIQIASHAEEKLAYRQHRHHHHRHHHLNEDTLKMLKFHLQSDQGEYLDEDAVVFRMLRMERVKRSKVQHNLICDVSEEEDNNAALRQAYQAVEDHSLALDFYNSTVADTRKENPGTALDKKTLDWLRKAMGLHHRDELWEAPASDQSEQSDESVDEAGSQSSKPRHLTRGVARSARIRKRKERATRENMGLDALMLAVMDLEKEHGPFRRESMSRVSYTLEMLISFTL